MNTSKEQVNGKAALGNSRLITTQGVVTDVQHNGTRWTVKIGPAIGVSIPKSHISREPSIGESIEVLWDFLSLKIKRIVVSGTKVAWQSSQ